MLASSDLDIVASDVSSMKDIRKEWASGSHGVRVLSAGAMYKQAVMGQILHPCGIPMRMSYSSDVAFPILHVVCLSVR